MLPLLPLCVLPPSKLGIKNNTQARYGTEIGMGYCLHSKAIRIVQDRIMRITAVS